MGIYLLTLIQGNMQQRYSKEYSETVWNSESKWPDTLPMASAKIQIINS